MAPRIFITAFEPYGPWQQNASWLALVEFTRNWVPGPASITTRLYPVDFQEVQRRLEQDLLVDYDYALHLGQAPGSAHVRLEAVGLNIGGSGEQPPETYRPLVADGPVAYRSLLPLSDWVQRLRRAEIPAAISYHAGTFLCNATLYWTHHFTRQRALRTQAAFIHLPLACSQASQAAEELACLPSSLSGQAVRLIVEALVKPEPTAAAEHA